MGGKVFSRFYTEGPPVPGKPEPGTMPLFPKSKKHMKVFALDQLRALAYNLILNRSRRF